jgi:hypothetical protein
LLFATLHIIEIAGFGGENPGRRSGTGDWRIGRGSVENALGISRDEDPWKGIELVFLPLLNRTVHLDVNNVADPIPAISSIPGPFNLAFIVDREVTNLYCVRYVDSLIIPFWR